MAALEAKDFRCAILLNPRDLLVAARMVGGNKQVDAVAKGLLIVRLVFDLEVVHAVRDRVLRVLDMQLDPAAPRSAAADLHAVSVTRLHPELCTGNLFELGPVLAVRQRMMPDHQADALFEQLEEVLPLASVIPLDRLYITITSYLN